MSYTIKNIPEDWEVKPMPEVVKWGSGGTPKSTVKEYYEGGNIPWLVIGDLNDGIVEDSESKITELGLNNSSAKMIPAGTLLVAMYGSIGKLGITGMECCTNQAIAYAKELHGVTTKYMFYYMAMLKSELISKGKGGTQKNISQTVLNSLEVIVPPIEVQDRIVYKIDEMLSEVNDGLNTLLKTKKQVALYKQALLKTVFFGEEAEQKRLEEVCDFITKGTTPSKDKMNNEGSTIPFIKVYNLTFTNMLDFTIDPTFVDEETHRGFLARSIVYPGDVLMNIVGPPMGKVSIVPDTYPEWNINQAIARFRCHEELDNKYLAYYFNYAKTVENMMKKAKATAGQFNLTLEICRNITIPVPDIETQREKVKYLEDKMSVCSEIEKTIDNTILQVEAMRQSLLKSAFEGRIL